LTDDSSLEVSSSALGAQVVRPQFVRDLDLIDKVWPKHLRPTSPASANPNHAPVVLPTPNNTPSAIIFPKVTLYCLMSVARSYTDFHIDFGGSSVFYHILRGNKTFLFIEPNAANLRRYEAWCGDSNQGHRFLGEEVKECSRVDLSAGDTMIIPSGWIHAVYTPTDSLVLGGNFLTPLHIPSQLNVASIEARTRVPKKFRFPFFDMAMWYTAIFYLDTYIPKRKRGPPPKGGRRNTEGMSEYEISGLQALAEWLWKKAKLRAHQIAKKADSHRAKVEVPPGIDAIETASRFAKWVYDAHMTGEGNPGWELPAWYRAEILLQKSEVPKKRKRDDPETPVRKYTKRSTRRDEDKRNRPVVQVVVPPRDETIPSASELFTLSRPVEDYSSIPNCMTSPVTTYSVSATDPPVRIPLIAYPPPNIDFATGQSLNVYRPYSHRSSQELAPPGQSFVKIIKRTCRPYYRSAPRVVPEEEIKAEEVSLRGLDVLTRAIELTNQPQAGPQAAQAELPATPQPQPQPETQQEPQAESQSEPQMDLQSEPLLLTQFEPEPELQSSYDASSSSESTLTVYSTDDSQVRLPTPSSPSPSQPSTFWNAAHEFRSRSLSFSTLSPAPDILEEPPSLKQRRKRPKITPTPTRVSPRIARAKSTSPTITRSDGTKTKRGNRVNEMERLTSLFSEDEMEEFRKRTRRGAGYNFGIRSLKRELERLGRQY
jgi:hypothetical protein